MKKIKLTPIDDDYKYIGNTYFVREGLNFPFNDAPYIPGCEANCVYFDCDDCVPPCRNCYGMLSFEKQRELKDIKNPDQNYHKYYTPSYNFNS